MRDIDFRIRWGCRLRHHVRHGLQGELGRIQGHGSRAYGTPRYLDLIKENFVDIKDDGMFRLDLDYFDYRTGLTMTNGCFDALFGGPPRRPEARLSQRDMDLAVPVQAVTEEIVLKLAASVARGRRTRPVPRRRCRAKRRRERQAAEAWRFDRMWLQRRRATPEARWRALVAAHMYKREPRAPIASGDGMRGSFLGPLCAGRHRASASGSGREGPPRCPTQRSLRMPPTRSPRARRWAGTRADGIRAARLGGRSILGDCAADDAETPGPQGEESRVVPVGSPLSAARGRRRLVRARHRQSLHAAWRRRRQRASHSDDERAVVALRHRQAQCSAVVDPAVTHVDYSARVQTVHKETNPRDHDLISCLKT